MDKASIVSTKVVCNSGHGDSSWAVCSEQWLANITTHCTLEVYMSGCYLFGLVFSKIPHTAAYPFVRTPMNGCERDWLVSGNSVGENWPWK